MPTCLSVPILRNETVTAINKIFKALKSIGAIYFIFHEKMYIWSNSDCLALDGDV